MDDVNQPAISFLQRSMFKWIRLETLWIVVLLLVATLVLAMGPMLQQSYPVVHSIHFNMMWAFQYAEQFLSGQFYPRWLEGSYFGLGNPTFVFYPPLCMVGMLPFAALGVSTSQALVGSMALAVGVRGLGSYRAARCLWPRSIALAVAIVAMLTPYFIVDVYQRGAIAEVWSLSLIPWVLWGAWRIVLMSRNQRTWGDWCVLAALMGLMGLTHLPGLLVWTLVWLLWPWCLARDRPDLKRLLVRVYGATALGLGMVAFFLLPAAFDQRWVSIDAINGWDIYDPLQRFLVYLRGKGWLTEQDYDRTLLPHFWIPLAVMGIALPLGWMGISGRWTRYSQDRAIDPIELLRDSHERYRFYARRILIFLCLITVVSSLMMTDLSAPLYQASPTLTRIQFPWRWMTVTASALPFAFGYLWDWVRSRSASGLRWAGWFGVLVLMGVCLWQGVEIAQTTLYDPALIARFDHVMEQRPQFPLEPEIEPATAEHFLGWHWAYPEGIAFVDAFEYRPLTAASNPVPPPYTYPLVDWIDGSGLVDIESWTYGDRQVRVESDRPGIVVLRTFAYPGWRVWENGQVVSKPGVHPDGRIQLPIRPGVTHIQISYRGTWAERTGWVITLGLGVGVLSLLGLEMGRRHNRSLKL